MSNILINPAQLREQAQKLTELAGRLRELRHQITESSEAAPSYDGQFAPAVRSLAAEAEALVDAQAQRIGERAQDLLATAQAFDAIDQQTLHELEALASEFRGWREAASISLSQIFDQRSPLWQTLARDPNAARALLYPEPGGEGGEEDWTPPWWAPLLVGAARVWGSFNQGIGQFFREVTGFGEPSYRAEREVEQFPIDVPKPSELPDIKTGTREELLFWSGAFGFGIAGRPTIDEWFSPYYWENPLTNESSTTPTEELSSAAEHLYQEYGGVELAAWTNDDNPLNFWEDDPITLLEGEERLQMGFALYSIHAKSQFGEFLDALEADRTLYWNYEPAWLEAKMRQNPNQLTALQFELLYRYAGDPETFVGLSTLKPAGPSE